MIIKPLCVYQKDALMKRPLKQRFGKLPLLASVLSHITFDCLRLTAECGMDISDLAFYHK